MYTFLLILPMKILRIGIQSYAYYVDDILYVHICMIERFQI